MISVGSQNHVDPSSLSTNHEFGFLKLLSRVLACFLSRLVRVLYYYTASEGIALCKFHVYVALRTV